MTTLDQRPTATPGDAFPGAAWRDWREHILTVDIESVHAAVIAERLERFLDECRVRGVSLRDVASATGTSRTILSLMARCRAYPREGVVARLQSAYPIDLNPVPEVRAATITALNRDNAALKARNAALEARCDELLEQLRADAEPPQATSAPGGLGSSDAIVPSRPRRVRQARGTSSEIAHPRTDAATPARVGV